MVSTGSTRRTCRVVSRLDVTNQVEFSILAYTNIDGHHTLRANCDKGPRHFPIFRNANVFDSFQEAFRSGDTDKESSLCARVARVARVHFLLETENLTTKILTSEIMMQAFQASAIIRILFVVRSAACMHIDFRNKSPFTRYVLTW